MPEGLNSGFHKETDKELRDKLAKSSFDVVDIGNPIEKLENPEAELKKELENFLETIAHEEWLQTQNQSAHKEDVILWTNESKFLVKILNILNNLKEKNKDRTGLFEGTEEFVNEYMELPKYENNFKDNFADLKDKANKLKNLI